MVNSLYDFSRQTGNDTFLESALFILAHDMKLVEQKCRFWRPKIYELFGLLYDVEVINEMEFDPFPEFPTSEWKGR